MSEPISDRIYLRDVIDPWSGKKVDESGPWQACPRCGQERIPSYNGIRRHDEFCSGLEIIGGPDRAIPLEAWQDAAGMRVVGDDD